MNNALGVARAVRTRRKCRRDSHAAGGVFPAGKENARWNRISRNASATRAENDSSRRAESLDARPSTLVPRSPLRRRAARANRPRRPKNRHPRSRTRTRNRYRRSRRFGSRARAARARRRHRTRDVVNRRVRRVVTKVPRRGAPSARRAMEESVWEVSGVSGSALGGFRCAGCAMGSGCVPGASLGEMGRRKRAGTYLRSALLQAPRRSLRPDPNERSEAVVVHRWTLLRPPTRSAWTASSATLGWTANKASKLRFGKIVAIGGEEDTC